MTEPQDTPGLLTVRAAARCAGRDERTVRRWIARGMVSTVDTPEGRRIDPAELLRIGALRHSPGEPSDAPGRAAEGSRTDTSDTELVSQLAAVRAELALQRQRADAAERDRDAWRAMAEQLARALPTRTAEQGHGEPRTAQEATRDAEGMETPPRQVGLVARLLRALRGG